MGEATRETSRTIVWLVAIVAGILVLLRLFFVTTARISHDGMAPTIVANERLAIWRSKGPYAIGDIVICGHPGELGRFVVGRVVGLPGQTLEAVNGMLKINNTIANGNDVRGDLKLRNAFTGGLDTMTFGYEETGQVQHQFVIRKRDRYTMRPEKIRSDRIFLLGDNRSYRGEDSRYFGEVDPTTCIGRVFMRLTPGPPRGDDIQHGYLDMLD